MRCCIRVYFALTCLLSVLHSFPLRARGDDGESQIKSDEQVLFFPTVAAWNEELQSWNAPVQGWILELEKDSLSRRIAIRNIRSLVGLEPNEPANALFEQRVRWFLADNERGKTIVIQIGGNSVTLNPSNVDGQFDGTVSLTASQVRQHSKNGRLNFSAVMKATDARSFTGVVHLCEPTGISVISDIDDTIKVSDVRDKKRLMQRTFLEPFVPVPGMSAKYRQWAAAGAQFHYVSASPWQFYEPLSSFLQQEHFPDGSYHLKRLRVKDMSVLKLFENPVAYKQSVIEELIRGFPKRSFLLVGDSGEKDPEVYGIIARRYPQQIIKVLIRDVTGQLKNDPRYQAAFQDVPAERWSLFQDAEKLDAGLAQ